jgi:hypothetical protein
LVQTSVRQMDAKTNERGTARMKYTYCQIKGTVTGSLCSRTVRWKCKPISAMIALMMGTQMVPVTSVTFNQPIRLSTQEDFNDSHRESCTSYISNLYGKDALQDISIWMCLGRAVVVYCNVLFRNFTGCTQEKTRQKWTRINEPWRGLETDAFRIKLKCVSTMPTLSA